MAILKIRDYEKSNDIIFDTLGNEDDSLEIVITNDNEERLCVDIVKEDAKQIISFLQNHFNL
jgi:hypothetical protein